MAEVALNLSIPSQEDFDVAWKYAWLVDSAVRQNHLSNQNLFPRYVMRHTPVAESSSEDFTFEFIDTSESGVSAKDISMELTIEKGEISSWALNTRIGCVCIYLSTPEGETPEPTDEAGDPLDDDEESTNGAAMLRFIDKALKMSAKN